MNYQYHHLLLFEQSRYVKEHPDKDKTSRLLFAQQSHSSRAKLLKSNFSALFPLMSKCVKFYTKNK